VLLITPHLVRVLARPDARSIEFAAGTESSTGARGGGIPSLPPIIPTPATQFQPGAPAQPEGAPAETKPAAPAVQPIVPFGGVKPPSQ